MRHIQRLVPIAILAATAGCYHATIETGVTPSTVTIERHWASSWIYGLVPPSTVEARSQCTGGVARVDTQLSFLNMVVGAITAGIYTPMDIVVTCAAGTAGTTPAERTITVGTTAPPATIRAAFDSAVARSARAHESMFVQFR